MMAFRNGNSLSCLSKTHTSMCRNCVTYAREMTNKRYNKIIKALTNDQGKFDLARAHRFEKLFMKELNKRSFNNYWRTDKILQTHIHNKILRAMEKKEEEFAVACLLHLVWGLASAPCPQAARQAKR